MVELWIVFVNQYETVIRRRKNLTWNFNFEKRVLEVVEELKNNRRLIHIIPFDNVCYFVIRGAKKDVE